MRLNKERSKMKNSSRKRKQDKSIFFAILIAVFGTLLFIALALTLPS